MLNWVEVSKGSHMKCTGRYSDLTGTIFQASLDGWADGEKLTKSMRELSQNDVASLYADDSLRHNGAGPQLPVDAELFLVILDLDSTEQDT